VATRVVIADDNYLVREGLVQLLGGVPGLTIIAACEDYDGALAAAESERPDVVVTDRHPHATDQTDEGIRLAGALRESAPGIGVVVLSQYSEPQYALGSKPDPPDAHTCSRSACTTACRSHPRSRKSPRAGRSSTPRSSTPWWKRGRAARTRRWPSSHRCEHQILSEIASGKSNAAIAESLVLTKRAVEKHINSIFLKLGLTQTEDTSRRVKATLLFLAEREGSAPSP